MLRPLFVLGCVVPAILGIPLSEDEYEVNKTNFVFEDLDHLLAYVQTPTERVRNLGYVAEIHQVVTEDGYILQMDRIVGSKSSHASDKKNPVLLIHGLLDTSAAWVLPCPEKGLGYILADQGYDVWMGNVRGSRFSRRHVTLSTKDKNYWMFSWHEMGMFDIPAMIDYILTNTRQEKLYYVGHSQGSTSFFVMASEKPEYQEKIIAAFTLAPAVFMSRATLPLIRLLTPHINNAKILTDLIGMYEFKPSSSLVRTLSKIMCKDEMPTQPLCKTAFGIMGGRNDKDFNITLIPEIAQYDPAGASTRQFIHYAQLCTSGNFAHYDHGLVRNLLNYGSIQPPKYNIANIKTPIYLYYGNNDEMVNVKDLEQLYETLPNAQKFLVPYKWFAHLDFLWGMQAKNLVYDGILNLMTQYKI
ncbi:lipase 3-like [Hylaeus volcanicus]|uniref:lipase 3-like n=1 Tax=Hylaeus volcanicus TaxID=313075 RepID=UPI0023B7DAEC|nr:lipase 3-like [Hylaeus volcanicus]XP_053990412.1 lipase 3-like [Hylaeus volcanicus]